MEPTKTHYAYGVFFVTAVALADAGLKALALKLEPVTNGAVGFHLYLNPGVTGSVEIPLWLVLPFSAALLCALMLAWRWSHRNKRHGGALGYAAIVVGGAGNFVDRLIHGHTTDYLKVASSVLNLSDILIIAGLLLLLRYHKSVRD
jgi:lipoprotein signal peptidase